jgi:hypothetical protein
MRARRAHGGRQDERRVGHAEGPEDLLLHDLAQPLSGNPFDHLASPVDIGAVLPIVARIEQ